MGQWVATSKRGYKGQHWSFFLCKEQPNNPPSKLISSTATSSYLLRDCIYIGRPFHMIILNSDEISSYFKTPRFSWNNNNGIYLIYLNDNHDWLIDWCLTSSEQLNDNVFCSSVRRRDLVWVTREPMVWK